MQRKMIPSAQPYFPPEEIDWILTEARALLENGKLVRGRHAAAFERGFAELVGVPHAITLSSGTMALEVALRKYALRGGEVVVPTNTFLASANAVLLAGGRPIFADLDPSTLCVGVKDVEARISPRTRGVIVVHIGGLVCPEIRQIAALCRARGLFLIEDASHAHGARWQGTRAGAFGDAAAFSLFPTKPMTTAEGGLLTTRDDDLAEFARLFRNHGTADGKTANDAFGSNYRMDELRALLGLSQLRSLEAFLNHRRAVAAVYRAGLAGVEDVELLADPPGMENSYYKFGLVLPTVERRDAVARGLHERHGVATGTLYWPPCHLQPVVRSRPDLYGKVPPLPAAEDVLPRVLCLPVSARLELGVADQIAAAVRDEVAAGRPLVVGA